LGMSGLTALILILYYRVLPSLSRGRIEVTRVKLSDDGNLVDINYLVRKPGRITKDSTGVYLLDELRAKKIKAEAVPGSGNVIDINTRLRSTGSIQLPNKNRAIKKGSFVTVAIGEYRREYLIVV
ncbi:MAG: hypothetical protein IBX64_09195, partial [Actinobacteria bacterium]|nr:hypothetical protein [Actinomycetota bacterium]